MDSRDSSLLKSCMYEIEKISRNTFNTKDIITIHYASNIYNKYLSKNSNNELNLEEKRMKQKIKNLCGTINNKVIQIQMKLFLFKEIIKMLLKYNETNHYNESLY